MAGFAFSDAFASQEPYALLPFRFIRIPNVPGRVLVTSSPGEWLFLHEDDFEAFLDGSMDCRSETFMDLLSKNMCCQGNPGTAARLLTSKHGTKKAFLRFGPSLHVFVVTLRCDHSCQYCQVSRRRMGTAGVDMTRETAMAAVDRLFESDSPELTVEFQGGEPLLAFDTIRAVTEEIERRNADHGRTISFSITSTLHQLTEEMAEFFRRHCFRVSTSLDGPQWLHNWNRPTDGRDGYRRTLSGLALARTNLGHGNVAALTTLTRESLAEPEAIVDAYVDQGFRSIFLRPLSPYGFAARSVARIGYSNDEFLAFYRRALAHILELNRSGVPMEEAYAGILLSHILTPWASGYVDLRSPAGAGFGCLVYNYDGSVYPSDEARMLAEMGDDSLRFGSVEDNLDTLYRSDAMRRLVDTGVAESLPRCSDCAFVPFCGADPVLAVRQGKAGGPSGPPEDFCGKHTGLFQILFEYLAEADPFVMRTFVSWATRREPGIPAEIL